MVCSYKRLNLKHVNRCTRGFHIIFLAVACKISKATKSKVFSSVLSYEELLLHDVLNQNSTLAKKWNEYPCILVRVLSCLLYEQDVNLKIGLVYRTYSL